MNDILDFINKHQLPDIDLGKGAGLWHKLEGKDFKGSYIYNVTNYKDKAVTLLTVYNFRTGDKFTERFGAEALTKAELQDVQKKIDEQNEKALAERERKQKECRDYAQSEWKILQDDKYIDGEHKYLCRKSIGALVESYVGSGVQNLSRFRFRKSLLSTSEIVVPFFDIDGTLWNYQTITEAGEKQVLIGGRLDGCFHPFFSNNSNFEHLEHDVVYICEGFATAASVFLALDQKYTVIAAIHSQNLIKVVEAVVGKFPECSFVICADNDSWKPDLGNAGLDAANKCISRFDGGSIGLPDFSGLNQETKPTDFNDLHCLSGLSEVKKQIERVKTERPAIIYPLGYFHKTYFFSTSKAQQIVTLNEFTEADMLKLAGQKYWANRFIDVKGKIDYKRATDFLIRQCQSRGLFSTDFSRGKGIYLDLESFAKHHGESVTCFPEQKISDTSAVKSRFYYDPVL